MWYWTLRNKSIEWGFWASVFDTKLLYSYLHLQGTQDWIIFLYYLIQEHTIQNNWVKSDIQIRA